MISCFRSRPAKPNSSHRAASEWAPPRFFFSPAPPYVRPLHAPIRAQVFLPRTSTHEPSPLRVGPALLQADVIPTSPIPCVTCGWWVLLCPPLTQHLITFCESENAMGQKPPHFASVFQHSSHLAK
ncbi:hypothetical protein TIFTF001_030238 [Ficus carica]|uniref:Uncharacterized protein n=1 Tax=Ficus carica TaxID=3494 RepID=A0AA88DTG1_FICCA|nr:hypothetical protein TIFTF001_030238 [Ficus carica]